MSLSNTAVEYILVLWSYSACMVMLIGGFSIWLDMADGVSFFAWFFSINTVVEMAYLLYWETVNKSDTLTLLFIILSIHYSIALFTLAKSLVRSSALRDLPQTPPQLQTQSVATSPFQSCVHDVGEHSSTTGGSALPCSIEMSWLSIPAGSWARGPHSHPSCTDTASPYAYASPSRPQTSPPPYENTNADDDIPIADLPTVAGTAAGVGRILPLQPDPSTRTIAPSTAHTTGRPDSPISHSS
ncbi:hypothetical protein BASA62_008994 [Batrachochytrium salamandrivorans]|nr:hypothetical protein BASA62_008994 [Batrachochytrium salamandrivorans]